MNCSCLGVENGSLLNFLLEGLKSGYIILLLVRVILKSMLS